MAGFGAGKSISIKRFARNYITSICILRRYLFPIQPPDATRVWVQICKQQKKNESLPRKLVKSSIIPAGVSERKMNGFPFLLEGHPQATGIYYPRKINIRSRNSEISALLAGVLPNCSIFTLWGRCSIGSSKQTTRWQITRICILFTRIIRGSSS